MLKRKLNFLIISIILSTILASCSGYTEIDDIALVTAVGIDYVDGKILLTHEVVFPTTGTSNDKSQPEPVLYLQHEGDTIFDAIRNVTLTFDRKLLYSHNRVVIFGEEFAKRGIGDYINFFLYDAEPRESMYMLVAKGSKAYEVMGINEGLADAPAQYIEHLVENYKYTSKTRSLNLDQYMKYYYSSKTPVLGVIEKEEKRIIDKETSQQKGNYRNVLNVEGGAVFYRDALIGYFTGEEMIGFNFLIDNIKESLIVFEVPDENISPDVEYEARKGKYTVVEIKKSNTKKDIKIENGKINLTIDVKIEGALGEETKGLDLTKLEVLNATEEACSNKVKEYITNTVIKAQEQLDVDAFSIDHLFHTKYPEQWQKVSDDWESVFAEIDYNINVKTNIVRTGLIDMPINVKKGDGNGS